MEISQRAIIYQGMNQDAREREFAEALRDENAARIAQDFASGMSNVSDAADAQVLSYETLRAAIDRMNHAPGPQEMFDMGGRWAEAYARTRRASRSVKIVREEPTLREIWND
jgi:hypothetical protein